MKISFDLDGTLLDIPALKEIFLALQKDHTVGVLTGHSPMFREQDFKRFEMLGVSPDFYLHSEHGFPNEVENSAWKGRVIAEQGIDYHFDDYDHLIPRYAQTS